MVEDPNVETSTCDGSHIRYNPKFVNDLSPGKLQGMLAHLTMHPAFLHHTRRGDRNKKKWNMACDYAINTLLRDAGFDLPKGTYHNSSYEGMTAEHIYSLLPDEPQCDSDNKSDGQSSDDPGGDGGVSDTPDNETDQKYEEAEWKMAVSQAAHVAKQAGHLPKGIEKSLQELFKPVLPWRAILRRFMTERRNDDFSWNRGNRRFISQGLYLPSRVSDEAMGEMVAVIDTSGSICQEQLDEFGAEIKSIVREVRPSKLRVIYCDSEIAHIDEFGPDDDIQFKAHGGGGTDFRPPFKWLDENHIVPRALVYLTDGYGPFPEECPAFPVMWAINNYSVKPPHGEHFIVET